MYYSQVQILTQIEIKLKIININNNKERKENIHNSDVSGQPKRRLETLNTLYNLYTTVSVKLFHLYTRHVHKATSYSNKYGHTNKQKKNSNVTVMSTIEHG